MAPLHETILATPPSPQSSCPLFNVIPPEIRSEIFSLALIDYPDPSPSKQYNESTPYTRPSYFAPRRSDTQLLQTCRAIYAECWYMPFLRKEQTHWLSRPDRAPPEYNVDTTRQELRSTLERIQSALPANERAEIDGLRVFAQMFVLEEGRLGRLVALKHLHPKRLTLTIRHTDWWYWESDEDLHIAGGWLDKFGSALSTSTQVVFLELETTQRKTHQLDEIVQQITSKWFIKRGEDDIMYADADNITTSVWTGTSTFNGQRWTRDETEDGKIKFHVVSIPFRPEQHILRRGGEISDVAQSLALLKWWKLSDQLDCRLSNEVEESDDEWFALDDGYSQSGEEPASDEGDL